MFQLINTIINKNDYFEYITKYAPKKIDNYFKNLTDDDYVNCHLIKLENSNPVYYDELWLLDIGDSYAPVLIQNINTSSCHSFWSCNFDDDFLENELNLDELLEMIGNGWRKGLRKVIENEYLNKKKEDCIDDIYNSIL